MSADPHPSRHENRSSEQRKGASRWVIRAVVLAVLVGIVVAARLLGLGDLLSFETLARHRAELTDFVQNRYVAALLGASVVYILVVSLSLQGGAVMSIASGFLFGQWVGTVLVVFSATVGASILFLLARTVLGAHFAARLGPWMAKVESGFRENAFHYILALRLVPLVPFSVLNPIPALFNVSLRDYVLSTGLGIIPGSFVFVSVGVGLGSILDQGGSISLGSVLTPQIIVALCGLAALALLPVLLKAVRGRKK